MTIEEFRDLLDSFNDTLYRMRLILNETLVENQDLNKFLSNRKNDRYYGFSDAVKEIKDLNEKISSIDLAIYSIKCFINSFLIIDKIKAYDDRTKTLKNELPLLKKSFEKFPKEIDKLIEYLNYLDELKS